MLSSYLCEVLHVWRLDVHDVKALVGVIKMPQVDTQIITRDERLLVTADGDGVDMVCVCVAKHPSTPRLHYLLHTGYLQQRCCRSAQGTGAA